MPAALAFAALVADVAATPRQTSNSPVEGYEYTCVGDCEPTEPTVFRPTGGAVLMGGGTDVPSAFEWLTRQADGGNILVLRATGTGTYNEFIHGMGLCRSAATLVITDPEAANDDFVIAKIEAAHGIFFAGGERFPSLSSFIPTLLHFTPFYSVFPSIGRQPVELHRRLVGLAAADRRAGRD